MPAFLATLVTEKGTLAGRRYSGRFFLGGMMETDVTSNDLAPAWITIVQAYVNALKTAFVTPATPDWRLFCFSSLLANGRAADLPNPGDPAVAAQPCQLAGSPVANIIVSTRPTTMRSRKLGHGL